MGERLDPEEIPDPVLEQIINTKGFQRMVAYSKLADGIEVLNENDALYESLVNSITTRSRNVSSESTVEEILNLLVEEVEEYTNDMAEEADGDGEYEHMDPAVLEDMFVGGS